MNFCLKRIKLPQITWFPLKNDMQDRLRQATFEDLLVLFTPCTREEFLSLAGGIFIFLNQ